MRLRIAILTLLALILPTDTLAAAPPPLTAPFDITPAFAPTDSYDQRQLFTSGATALTDGSFAVAWSYELRNGTLPIDSGMDGRLVSFQGQAGGEFGVFHNTTDPAGEGADCPALAAFSAGGFVVSYVRMRQVGSTMMASTYGPYGGADILVSDVPYTTDIGVSCPMIGASPDGRFVVAWAQTPINDEPYSWTYKVRAFGAGGQPLGAAISLDAPLPSLPFGAYESPAIGMDRSGRFVAVWRGVSSPGLMARRFAADGAPAGAPFLIAASYASDPAISMAPEGDFAVAYTKPAPAGKPQALVIRRFAADGSEIGTPVSPGAVIAFGSPKVSTDRYGNFVLYWQEKDRTRAQIFNRSRAARGPAFDAGPAETTVALADSGRLLTAWRAGNDLRGRIWRGLKEDSYCVYRGNAFLCDAAVNGQEVPAAALGLGYPTDVPLLGDVDGDGRVDACTHRGNRFLCDTKHDGGTAEVKIAFGNAGETALLGDVDGDGRADPCIHRGALFLCDTKHDGGAAEVKIAFGVPGDLGLLGDVNGDGKADVCIYRSGVFACDTAHDGVFAELKLDLRPALQGVTAGVPLLGDIDGDGRADACLLRGAQLTCGLFDKAGGAPYAVVDRPVFLQPGDWPLLGGLAN